MQCVKYPDISAKVCSSSSVIPLYFSCSLTSSSSNLSTSFCSFITHFSANSARASACFSLAVSVLICSLYVFSRVFAFSSATSKDFRLLAATLSSSSSSTILVSPTSARSSAFSRSASHCASFLATSSYVASAASAFSLASFRSFSNPLILFSSSSALLWKTFFARSESSEAVTALSSLPAAATIFSSVFSRSSSKLDTRLLRAFISSSVAARAFSFSSSCRETIPNLSTVRSSSVSSCLALFINSSTSSSPFWARILAALQASSQTSTLSQALSFSTFMACIFFLIASILVQEEDVQSRQGLRVD